MRRVQARGSPAKKASTKDPPRGVKKMSSPSPPAALKSSAIETRLPFPEVAIYTIFLVVTFSTAFYNVYISSQERVDDFSSYMLQPGWSLLGNRYKDTADFEWAYWTAMISPLTILLLLGHVVLGRVVENLFPKFRKHFLLMYALMCLVGMFGLNAVMVYILYTVAVYLASLTRSAVVVWGVILVEILSTNVDFFVGQLHFFFPDGDLLNHVIFGITMCQLRLLSYGLEYCKSTKQTKATGTHRGNTNETWSFFSIMSYNFYLPLFASGPIMTYNSFSQQINQSPRPFTKDELKAILKEFARYIFWGLFAEVVLHFLYFPAFHEVWYIFQFLPKWSLAGIGLCHLLFFQVKYVVTYGLPRAIALFDRIEAPLPPVCVLGMYTFQDMWRYFDRGLNALLVSTIYIPMGGSKQGLVRQLLASMLCFSFVFYWHGVERHLFYWALINWLGVVVEVLGQRVVEWLAVESVLKSKLSSSAYCRIHGLFLTPNYMLLALSNLVFLGGIRVAHTYFYRFILIGWPGPLLMFFTTFYCVLQVTKALHQHFGKDYLCKKLYAV